MKKLNAALLLLGLFFFTWLLWRVGPAALWRGLGSLGWGVLPLVASEGVANLAHTIGWRHCLDPAGRRVSLLRLFRMAMAGYAVNYLTPTASLGGEVTRGALLSSASQTPQAFSSVLADKLCLAFAHLLLVILGSFLFLGTVHLSGRLWLAMVAGSVLLGCGIVAFMLLQKYGKLGGFARWLASRRVGGARLARAAVGISRVDESLKSFYRERPRALLNSVTWHFLGHSINILQVWLFLVLLGQPAPIFAVLVAAFLGLWIDLLTFAVPMNLGALEASRIVALKAIGLASPLGMTYAIAIRIAQVFWAVFGLINYGVMALRCPALRPGRAAFSQPSRPPAIQRLGDS